MPLLRIIDGADKGRVFEIAEDRVTLGREPENAICLPDVKASRVHAELARKEGRWTLKDLGSSNGTWSEDGRIDSAPLADGATFRIGRTWLRFESKAPATASELASVGGETVVGLDRTHTSGLLQPAGGDRVSAYLALLHHIVLQSNGARGRDELFDILDDISAEALEGDRVAVFLPAADGWSLWPPHEKRLRARWGAVPFARTLLEEIRTRREPLLVALPPTARNATPEADFAPSQSMVQAGVISAMAAPLRLGDEVQALLYVDRVSGAKAFSRTDLEFLAAVANQLAVQLSITQKVAQLTAEVERLAVAPRRQAVQLVGSDPALQAVHAFVARAAPTHAPVLILGESGTGKELVARAVHQQSKRADKPLQVVNCAAIAENLVESTLFGHVKGAFTGADETRPGVFELADGATLFLDEVGELPMATQAKLLRALEQGEVQRVGDGGLRKVDVRVIAATNRDLAAEAAAGRFREDLYHRLNVLCVTLPPLRERPADIEALIEYFLAEAARRLGQPAKRLTPEARTLLLRYPWPGNVRQLRNLLERASVLAAGEAIQPGDLPPEVTAQSATIAVEAPMATLASVEKAHILRVLERCGGNKKQAADVLAIDRSTLYAKLKQYGQ
ncbi:MAG: sigma 54-interacting transcriptional regulator [Planctomycetes bacterium]|nr:sigma 54-interacting transcriptional regulator [Planctomycetota bacterium]